ncbi:MAG: inositol 2-dehydrogenase [Saprospiraceae bacterium]
MNPLKIGVVGLGRIGKVHLENLVYRIPEAVVIAASTPSDTGYEFAKNLGVTAIHQDALNVIKHKNIDAVILCGPTNTHLPHIKAAAKAGKHIFCEKPLALTVKKIERIHKMVSKAKVKLQVGFNRRFDPNFAAVQQQVSTGKIGDPHILKITSRDPAPPPIKFLKVSGGLFMDMTIHDFDMARFIVNSEVVEVFAKAAVRVDKAIGEVGDIDTAVITLKFANGCLAVIDNSRQAVYGYDQRLEIFGSKGMSKIDNNYADTQQFFNKKGSHKGLPYNFFMTRYTESYCKEMQAFIHAIKNNEPIIGGVYDALMATKIAIAANESVRKNKPIKIK